MSNHTPYAPGNQPVNQQLVNVGLSYFAANYAPPHIRSRHEICNEQQQAWHRLALLVMYTPSKPFVGSMMCAFASCNVILKPSSSHCCSICRREQYTLTELKKRLAADQAAPAVQAPQARVTTRKARGRAGKCKQRVTAAAEDSESGEEIVPEHDQQPQGTAQPAKRTKAAATLAGCRRKGAAAATGTAENGQNKRQKTTPATAAAKHDQSSRKQQHRLSPAGPGDGVSPQQAAQHAQQRTLVLLSGMHTDQQRRCSQQLAKLGVQYLTHAQCDG
jgi:hypothetical protein